MIVCNADFLWAYFKRRIPSLLKSIFLSERYGEIGLLRFISALLFAVLSIGFAYYDIYVSEGLILASLISQASSALCTLRAVEFHFDGARGGRIKISDE